MFGFLQRSATQLYSTYLSLSFMATLLLGGATLSFLSATAINTSQFPSKEIVLESPRHTPGATHTVWAA